MRNAEEEEEDPWLEHRPVATAGADLKLSREIIIQKSIID